MTPTNRRYKLLKPINSPDLKAEADTEGVLDEKSGKVWFGEEKDFFYNLSTVLSGIGTWFEEITEQESQVPQFVIGVDPIRGNFEWKDDAQTQVIFKKEERGEWVAMYRSDKAFSQEQFEADMKKAAEYFSKIPLLCEECGEIGKHKPTCSQYPTPPPVSNDKDYEILEFKVGQKFRVLVGDGILAGNSNATNEAKSY
jgi:hypothetical protein